MTVYAWDQIFLGLDVTWSEERDSINIGLDTTLVNPTTDTNEQLVTIDAVEYDFSADTELWQALWDWAVVKADNAETTANQLESIRIRNAISEFEIEA